MHAQFWPSTAGWLLTSSAFVVSSGCLLLAERLMRSPAIATDTTSEYLLSYCQGERDRLQGIAKGEAVAASGFLVAVLTALLKGEISRQVAPFYLVCCVLGVIGTLMIALKHSRASAQFMVSMAPKKSASAKW